MLDFWNICRLENNFLRINLRKLSTKSNCVRIIFFLSTLLSTRKIKTKLNRKHTNDKKAQPQALHVMNLCKDRDKKASLVV